MNQPRTPAAVLHGTRAAGKAGARRWLGRLEGVQGELLYGWALDRRDTQARVVLEVLLDGEAIAATVADVARPDLAAQLDGADPCHGFVADLGALDGAARGMLTVRVANTAVVLPGHADHAPPPAALGGTAGGVYGDGGLRLHGWSRHPYLPQTQTVQAFVGALLVAGARADRFYPHLRGQAAERHGFQLELPVELADGKPHSVRVVDQDGVPLNGSPVTVCCHASGLRALLPPDQPALLTDVIQGYERLLPRGLGLAGYRQWTALFEAAGAPGPARPGPAPSVAIIVSGPGDDQAYAHSAASLAARPGQALRVYAAGPGRALPTFAAALRAALDDGNQVLGCVQAGDALAPQALAWALDGLALPGAQLVYADSECDGRPWFKPAWNPEYALASDYPLDGMLMRADAVRAAGAQAAADPAALAWQVLAGLWRDGAEAIVHVPRVLYQRRRPPDAGQRQARHAAAAAALQRIAPGSTLAPLAPPADAGYAARRVRHPLPAALPAVSLIIPTRDHGDLLQRCIDSIERHTAWPALELIVVDNGSVQPASRRYLRALARRGVTVLARPGPFNYAALNNDAVALARGEIVGLLNNDVEALHDGWLEELLAALLQPGVVAAGAKLLWPNGMVQHGGVVLGLGNLAGHYGNHLADADWGDHGRNQLSQRVSAVTAACMLLRKRDYLAAGGMDAQAFPVAFNDVDLCLKLQRGGGRIVWTPHARLLHAESASRGHDTTPAQRQRLLRESERLRRRWQAALLDDRAYHPSLSLDLRSALFSGLALPPRPRAPRRAGLPAAED
ncbi:glycosyltransferase family 2 protein [Duganella sp. CT11-72]|uniref:glycosyltransferase family 2 protein n=1 Tax=Duganella sp. CT11-72 TaxID=3243052 RepID=UPI0039AF26BF